MSDKAPYEVLCLKVFAAVEAQDAESALKLVNEYECTRLADELTATAFINPAFICHRYPVQCCSCAAHVDDGVASPRGDEILMARVQAGDQVVLTSPPAHSSYQLQPQRGQGTL